MDGLFGPSTRAALRRWQGEKSFAATGYLTRAQADTLVAQGREAAAAAQAEAARQRQAQEAAEAEQQRVEEEQRRQAETRAEAERQRAAERERATVIRLCEMQAES